MGPAAAGWYSEYMGYPESNKKARDWVAEENFAKAWRPSHSSGSAVLSKADARLRSEDKPALPPREKRPRDCQPTCSAIHTPPAKRAAREGEGRPKGSFGRKRLRALLHQYKVQVEQGQLTFARLQLRDLGSAMLAASQEADKPEKYILAAGLPQGPEQHGCGQERGSAQARKA
ncbi:hypothetical protein Esi_0040_0016 [Ectocarpus siliculosus]|uniref:Uncharacterized protein n=1 Tax=Ectocarpus siliculosus TaxID=2880 RepID=D7G0B2_ECTSI|nr:hypothetical protein Esi_0040_0016 [Ectocarpus siliculosus]|eukprot:CBJ26639.1 hypothetical protein Esi_0040_0016 [Ectocarpus siliculosus]